MGVVCPEQFSALGVSPTARLPGAPRAPTGGCPASLEASRCPRPRREEQMGRAPRGWEALGAPGRTSELMRSFLRCADTIAE